MRLNLFKIYLFSFLLISDFVVLAQPGVDDGSGGLEGNDPPPAPINSKLIWLALFGVVLAFNHFKTQKQNTNK